VLTNAVLFYHITKTVVVSRLLIVLLSIQDRGTIQQQWFHIYGYRSMV